MARTTSIMSMTVAVALTLAACTRPEDAVPVTGSTLPVPSATTTSTTSVPSTTTVSTEPTPPTSAAITTAPPTTAPPTTAPRTTAPAAVKRPTSPADLTLIFDGIGTFRFGDRDVDVVPTLTNILGAPVQDDITAYPVADDGAFLDDAGEEAFIAPFGRTVCYADGLCVQFGAGAPETLLFSGWRLDDSGTADLRTDDGITIGSTWAGFDDYIVLDPVNSCYQVGYADAGGVDVTLISNDGVFAAPNAAGDGLDIGDPDPALVTVIELSAGRLPRFVFADC